MTRSERLMNELDEVLNSIDKFKAIGVDVFKIYNKTPDPVIKISDTPTKTLDNVNVVKSVKKPKKIKAPENLDQLKDAVLVLLKTSPMKPSDIVASLKEQDLGVTPKHLPISIAEVLTYLKQSKQVERLEDKTYQLI